MPVFKVVSKMHSTYFFSCTLPKWGPSKGDQCWSASRLGHTRARHLLWPQLPRLMMSQVREHSTFGEGSLYSQPAGLQFKRTGTSVTRLGDFLDFGQLYKAFGNNKFAQISHILRHFFVKVSKYIIFLSFLATFIDIWQFSSGHTDRNWPKRTFVINCVKWSGENQNLLNMRPETNPINILQCKYYSTKFSSILIGS